jgi:hypothetical protein
MRKLNLRSFFAGLLSGAFLVGAIASCILPALALVVPGQFAPRQFPTQQTHYLRFTFNFNSCTTVSNTCSIKIGALPYNAFLTVLNSQIITTFNPTTSATVAIGTASGGAQIATGLNVFTAAATTLTTNTAFAGAGELVTGAGATQTGGDGGFDVWATYTVGSGTATQGQVVFVLSYIAPNDGSCTTVPMNATATAC